MIAYLMLEKNAMKQIDKITYVIQSASLWLQHRFDTKRATCYKELDNIVV